MIFNNYSEIDKINETIHDCWFFIDKITVNNEKMSILFTKEKHHSDEILKKVLFLKKRKYSIVQYSLNIFNVINYNIQDTANINKYDFNKLIYSLDDNEIQIVSNFPLVINIQVKNFRIEIEELSIIKEKKYYSLK